MATKMSVTNTDIVSTTVRDGTTYEVQDGTITVENGEHIAELAAHGYTLGGGSAAAVAVEPSQAEKGLANSIEKSEPEPELPLLPETDPDFDKLNRTQLVEFLETYGVRDRKASEDKQALVAAAVARLAELRAAAAAAAEAAEAAKSE